MAYHTKRKEVNRKTYIIQNLIRKEALKMGFVCRYGLFFTTVLRCLWEIASVMNDGLAGTKPANTSKK